MYCMSSSVLCYINFTNFCSAVHTTKPTWPHCVPVECKCLEVWCRPAAQLMCLQESLIILIFDDSCISYLMRSHEQVNVEQLKAWGECAPTGPYWILPNYWQEPVNSKEGSFERYERILQGPLLINKQTGFVFVLLHGARMPTLTNPCRLSSQALVHWNCSKV